MKSPHTVRRKLIRDPHAYVETVAKPDLAALADVLDAQDGTGTVVRVFFGATEQLPVRALSYIISALRVGQLLPCEQVQVVSVNNLGTQLNGISTNRARQQTQLLAAMGTLLVASHLPEMEEKVLFAEDTYASFDEHIDTAAAVIGSDDSLRLSLSKKGTKHGGDFTRYAAAHFAYQDTNQLELSPVCGGLPTKDVQRIVSVGCQQERIFYRFRKEMRDITRLDNETAVTSVQVFTQHVSPPYYVARHGEQLLEAALHNGFDMLQTEDRAAQRDLQHLCNFIGEYNGTN